MLLTNHGLPFASSPWVAGEFEIGLKTHFTGVGDGGLDFTSVVCSSWESNTLKEDLEEDLSVESEGSRVEGYSLDGRVDVVSTSDEIGRAHV